MAAAITEVTEYSTLENNLTDYVLHLSGSSVSTQSHSETVATSLALPPNPSNWPTQYRRIPPYRPVNRHLDQAERPNGANGFEFLFVTVMLNGVHLQSVSVSMC
ncbi:X-Pro dipeptidyl-peptidase C-terminal non-catalytic domain-containing protein [Colletotrichum asianum]|uniref:X-Pro dipeptidyl-peptidase C-terminal non-catalytic domain-containing protein n=1 Tax=Colletotrichum asianum TaxID=702518 RepID=A0A8H3ZKU2_9PEZI|nr:X-Pro dipeptidyl-peptidase C-terminal non-catalytic domain-containing protein [Colletotrichum asianum]